MKSLFSVWLYIKIKIKVYFIYYPKILLKGEWGDCTLFDVFKIFKLILKVTIQYNKQQTVKCAVVTKFTGKTAYKLSFRRDRNILLRLQKLRIKWEHSRTLLETLLFEIWNLNHCSPSASGRCCVSICPRFNSEFHFIANESYSNLMACWKRNIF